MPDNKHPPGYRLFKPREAPPESPAKKDALYNRLHPKSAYWRKVFPRLEVVQLWAREGASRPEIAARLGVAAGTFHQYAKQHPELEARLKHTREFTRARVLEALIQRAMGYTYYERKVEQVTSEKMLAQADKAGVAECGGVVLKVTTTTKHIVPDPGSCIFLLTNLGPEHWRNPMAAVGDTGSASDRAAAVREFLKAAKATIPVKPPEGADADNDAAKGQKRENMADTA